MPLLSQLLLMDAFSLACGWFGAAALVCAVCGVGEAARTAHAGGAAPAPAVRPSRLAALASTSRAYLGAWATWVVAACTPGATRLCSTLANLSVRLRMLARAFIGRFAGAQPGARRRPLPAPARPRRSRANSRREVRRRATLRAHGVMLGALERQISQLVNDPVRVDARPFFQPCVACRWALDQLHMCQCQSVCAAVRRLRALPRGSARWWRAYLATERKVRNFADTRTLVH